MATQPNPKPSPQTSVKPQAASPATRAEDDLDMSALGDGDGALSPEEIAAVAAELGADDAAASAAAKTTPLPDAIKLPIDRFDDEAGPLPNTGSKADEATKQQIVAAATRIERPSREQVAAIDADSRIARREQEEDDLDRLDTINSLLEKAGITGFDTRYNPHGDNGMRIYTIALPEDVFTKDRLAALGFSPDAATHFSPKRVRNNGNGAGTPMVSVSIPADDMAAAVRRKTLRLAEAEKLFGALAKSAVPVDYKDDTAQYEIVVPRPVMEAILKKNEAEQFYLPAGEWKNIPATVRWRVPLDVLETLKKDDKFVIPKDMPPELLSMALRYIKPLGNTTVTKSQQESYYAINGVPTGTPLSELFADEERQKAIAPGKTCRLLIPKLKMEQILDAAKHKQAAKPAPAAMAPSPAPVAVKSNYDREKFLGFLRTMFPAEGYVCNFDRARVAQGQPNPGCFVVQCSPDTVAKHTLQSFGIDSATMTKIQLNSSGPLEIVISEETAMAAYDKVAEKVATAKAPAPAKAATGHGAAATPVKPGAAITPKAPIAPKIIDPRLQMSSELKKAFGPGTLVAYKNGGKGKENETLVEITTAQANLKEVAGKLQELGIQEKIAPTPTGTVQWLVPKAHMNSYVSTDSGRKADFESWMNTASSGAITHHFDKLLNSQNTQVIKHHGDFIIDNVNAATPLPAITPAITVTPKLTFSLSEKAVRAAFNIPEPASPSLSA